MCFGSRPGRYMRANVVFLMLCRVYDHVSATRSSIAVDTLTIHMEPDGLFLIIAKTLKCMQSCVRVRS